MITLQVEFIIYSINVEEFIALTKIMQEKTLTEKGCISYDVFQVNDVEQKLIFVETFVDSEAIEFHKNQDYFQEWRNKISHMINGHKNVVKLTKI